jgi:glutamine synthetase
MEKLSRGEKVQVNNGEHLELGVTTMPKIPKHLADRNRTSPFAFTGNKFEFRMVPSSGSISEANTTLNTAVAEVLRDFADRLESADDIQETVKELVRESYRNHKRVVFNGNNYSHEWVEEAGRRGLPNITTTVDAIAEMTAESSVELFDSHAVYSRDELSSRQAICYENYVKQIGIEANVMISMGRTSILPAAFAYSESLANSISSLHQVDPQLDSSTQRKTLEQLLGAIGQFDRELDTLESLVEEGRKLAEASYEQARFYRYRIFEQMKLVRHSGDVLETVVPRNKWPYPSYEEMLFRL